MTRAGKDFLIKVVIISVAGLIFATVCYVWLDFALANGGYLK